MKFNEKLRYLMEERNITQKLAAEDLHIAPSTMSGYVRGVSEPDFETLKTIAEYFGVTVDFLLDTQSSGSESSAEEGLLKTFREMTPQQQATFVELGKTFVRVSRENFKKNKSQ